MHLASSVLGMGHCRLQCDKTVEKVMSRSPKDGTMGHMATTITTMVYMVGPNLGTMN